MDNEAVKRVITYIIALILLGIFGGITGGLALIMTFIGGLAVFIIFYEYKLENKTRTSRDYCKGVINFKKNGNKN